MKKEAKGQRVKTFKHWIPQPDLTKKDVIVVVYFKADEGLFYIYDGDHMLAACRNEASESYHLRSITFRQNCITSNTLNELIKGFESLCHTYEKLLKEAKKSRVIRFVFKRNLYGNVHSLPKDDISFCGTPAIHFTFEVLWRVKDTLYRQHTPEESLQYAGEVKPRHKSDEHHIVEWSQEREDFFSNMRDALISLIVRVENFQKDLVANLDLAIAGGGALLLESPKP